MNAEVETLIRHALAATRAGSLDQAQSLLLQSAQLDPSSAIPLFLMGANFAQAGRNEEAEAAYTSCLTRNPTLAIARFQLGLLQLTNGRAVLARATWEPLLTLETSNPLRHFVRGFMEILGGDKGAAERSIREGMGWNLDNPSLNDDMLGVLSRLDRVGRSDVPAPTPYEQSTATAPVDTLANEHFLIAAYRRS